MFLNCITSIKQKLETKKNECLLYGSCFICNTHLENTWGKNLTVVKVYFEEAHQTKMEFMSKTNISRTIIKNTNNCVLLTKKLYKHK